MKKIISIFLTLVILSGLCVSVSAQEEYDGYAYGSYAYGGTLIFYSRVSIYDLENVEKLTIQVNYNPKTITAPTIKAPEYFSVTEDRSDGRITLTITEGNGIYENEKFDIAFDVLDKNLRREDTGFLVTAKALFKDGSEKELKIKNNVEVYIDEPTGFMPPDEITIRSDKMFFINNDTITFSIPVHPIDNAEKIRVKFICDKNLFSISEIKADKDLSYISDATEDGYSITYNNPQTDKGNLDITFSITGTGRITFFINCFRITETGEESEINRYAEIPFTQIYNPEEITRIILSDRFELYRDGDTLYFPFTMTEKDFEGEFYSTAGKYGVCLAYMAGSNGYSDRTVATGEEIIAYTGGTVSDRIKICIMGDINCSGSVTSADARLALRHSAQLEKLEDIKASVADADRNGEINAADARMILRVAAELEKFKNSEKTVFEGEEFVVEKLKNAGSGAYNWKCTVSDETAFEITDTIAPPEGVEIKPGTPFEQTFKFKALKAGVYNVHFELIASWEEKSIDEFEFTVVVCLDEPFVGEK